MPERRVPSRLRPDGFKVSAAPEARAAEDLVAAVTWLLSPGARFVTGAVIVIAVSLDQLVKYQRTRRANRIKSVT